MTVPADADRYAHVKLALNCPRCGSTGLIALDGLDRMLFCYGCRQRYRLERQGLVAMSGDRVQVQVRTNLSDWQNHEAVLQSRSARLGIWLVDRAADLLSRQWLRWATLTASVAALGVWIALGPRGALKKPLLEIPSELTPRAEMFSQALAHRNMEVMIRLTDPAQHRALRIWLAHGTNLPPRIDEGQADLAVKITSTKSQPGGDRAELRVQLSGDGKLIVLDQQWAQRPGGAWYFQPVRLRSTTSQKAPVVPYSKAKAKHRA